MNLNCLEQYDDPVDQWAAEREFELREAAYWLACTGIAPLMKQAVENATQAVRDFRVKLVGLDNL